MKFTIIINFLNTFSILYKIAINLYIWNIFGRDELLLFEEYIFFVLRVNL